MTLSTGPRIHPTVAVATTVNTIHFWGNRLTRTEKRASSLPLSISIPSAYRFLHTHLVLLKARLLFCQQSFSVFLRGRCSAHPLPPRTVLESLGDFKLAIRIPWLSSLLPVRTSTFSKAYRLSILRNSRLIRNPASVGEFSTHCPGDFGYPSSTYIATSIRFVSIAATLCLAIACTTASTYLRQVSRRLLVLHTS